MRLLQNWIVAIVVILVITLFVWLMVDIFNGVIGIIKGLGIN